MENDPHDYAWVEAEDPLTVSLGPMGSLFKQLRSTIAWQYSRLKGVKTEIQILGQGLEVLCTDLKDFSEAEDTITRCWVRQVRDLCYDTSDYLDELMHFIHYSSGTRPRTRLLLENRLGSKIFRVSRRPMLFSFPKVKKWKRVPLIEKLSSLVARVEDADERRTRFKISPPQASKHDCAQAAGVSHLKPQLPLQLHVDNLIKLLGFNHDHDERNLMVVTIFGSAGVGKTALARTLYHRYRGRFQYRAFLRVSRDPDMRRLLADLLSQMKAPSAHAFSDIHGLIATITKHLQGKSYLIVTDDLWDTSTWDIISHAFPDGDNCRIIITTQIKDVALACCNDQLKHIYEITPLNGDQSGISEGGCTTYPTTEGMKEALNLVYNNLPPHLKTCLLYLNIYPEGWSVMKDELVKQWVAEGLIGSVKGQDAEETAGCYFEALVSTGMVQSVDTNHNDEVLSCTLHHMVLDLIRQKSMEENFVTIVNYFQTIIGLPDKVRRLSVQLGGAKGANNISGNMRKSQVRSLIFSGFFKSVPSIVEYGLLQVLILHIWSDQDRILDLTTIGQLYQLRYLKIESSITVKLPHKIQRLKQLGTLHVDARLYAIPYGIVHLEKLLHLRLPSDSILPHGVGHMTSLRTLGYFDLGCNSEDNVRDLGDLKNLQDLQLTCSAVQPAQSLEKNVQLLLGSILKKLSVLQSVTLVPAAGSSNVNTLEDGAGASSMSISCDGSSNMFPAPVHLRRLELSRRCCILSRLPKWLGELAQLCILKIAVVELSKEDIGILNVLPALASLSLNVVTMSTEKIVFGKEGFSVLRYFKFTCTAPWLKFEAGAMPNLEKLKLRFSVPIGIIIIERLSGLKEISAIIGYAGVDAESALWKAIINDPSNPEVQLTGPIYYRDQGRGMVTTHEGSGEDGCNEADIRVHMQRESSRQPVPARCREKEPEDRPFMSEIISIPSESDSTDVHAGQKKQSGDGGGRRLPTRQQSKPKPRRFSLSIAETELGMTFIPHVHQRQIPAGGRMQSGTFRDGDLLVNKDGLRIVPQSEEGEHTQIEPLDNHQLSIDDLEAFKVIWKGSSGYVQLVRHKWTGQFIALKVIQLNIQENIRKQIVQELKISFSTQCQYVVTCYQCFYVNGLICIALEYMDGGSLADFLKTVRTIPEAYLAAICKQVLKGLMYLHHEKHIIHRDMKPSNILINHRGEIKISDFGVSAIIASSSAQRDTFTGTFNYMAPERISGQKHGYMSDIWSLGLVMLECATGNFPYPPGDSFYELLEAVVDQPPPSAPSDQHSPEFCSFISACIQKNAKDRSSAQILLAHPFLSMYNDLNIDLADYFTTAGSPLATFKKIAL